MSINFIRSTRKNEPEPVETMCSDGLVVVARCGRSWKSEKCFFTPDQKRRWRRRRQQSHKNKYFMSNELKHTKFSCFMLCVCEKYPTHRKSGEWRMEQKFLEIFIIISISKSIWWAAISALSRIIMSSRFWHLLLSASAWAQNLQDNDRRLIAIITSNNLNNHNFKHSSIKIHSPSAVLSRAPPRQPIPEQLVVFTQRECSTFLDYIP